MAPITKDFLKSAGLFCLFLSLQLIIPFLAFGLSQVQVFHGTQFILPGIEGKLLAITVPAMAFSFFIAQLAYILLLHSACYSERLSAWSSGRMLSSNSNNSSIFSVRSIWMRVCRKLGMPLNKGVAAKWRRTWRMPRYSSMRSTL